MYVAGLANMQELKRLSEPLKTRRIYLKERLSQASGPHPKIITPVASVARAYAAMADRSHLALNGEDAEELRTELCKLIRK